MITVFFGGRSCEHDISIITGLQTLSACRERCMPVYIDGDGVWWTGDGFDSLNAVKNKKFKGRRVHIRPGEPYLYCKNRRLFRIEAAVLCMHGVLGEDGSLQGLLQLCGVPYTGSGVLASAIGMNKLAAKRVFKDAGLSVVPYMSVTRDEYTRDVSAVLKKLKRELKMPVIVKPCNLGSSIGISVAKTQTELFRAIRIALEWDDTLIIESALDSFTEVNCAVIGDAFDGSYAVSDTEQPVGWKEFLTFSDKYSGDVKSAKHKIPAEIGEELNDAVKDMAVKAFFAVGCSGVARVDFLLKDGDIYVNEINTIPGSLASPLFRRDMDNSQLIDMLIGIAKKTKSRADALKRVYDAGDIVGK